MFRDYYVPKFSVGRRSSSFYPPAPGCQSGVSNDLTCCPVWRQQSTVTSPPFLRSLAWQQVRVVLKALCQNFPLLAATRAKVYQIKIILSSIFMLLHRSPQSAALSPTFYRKSGKGRAIFLFWHSKALYCHSADCCYRF